MHSQHTHRLTAPNPRQNEHLAVVALGSNLGVGSRTPGQMLAAALATLAREDGMTLIAISALRRTHPVGPVEQPDFLNAVALLSTALDPHTLLVRLLEIERRLGRDRASGVRWGPRCIDLDLLLLGDVHVQSEALTLPHPRMHERRFVLEPLCDIAPDLALPAPLTGLTPRVLLDALACEYDAG